MASDPKEPKNPDEAVVQPTALVVNQPAVPVPSSPNISTDNALMTDFIRAMREETEVKKKELEIREKQIDKGHDYAMKALDVQERDLTNGRKESRLSSREYMIGGGFAVVVLAAFLMFCIYTNNAAVALEVIKILGTAALSAIGGYYYGKSKRGQSADSSSDSNATT